MKADSGRASPVTLLAYHRSSTDTIPLSQVAKIQTHQPDALKVLGLVIVGLFVALFTAYPITCWDYACS